MPESLAHALADYAASLRYEDLSPTLIHETKRRFIDSVGCAWGAYREPAPAIARSVARHIHGTPGASLFGGGVSSPDWAAFANGVHIRYLDFNDTYLSKEPAHPSDNLSAVLACGELAGKTGRDAILAAVLAYEIQCRMADAASIRARGWDHVTYGCFSTALAAARLLNLNRDQTVHALGLAGVASAALRQTRAGELSMWKGCAFAGAARQGVFAAMLAAEGMSGPAPIFEGEMGFFKQVSGPFELPTLGGVGGAPFKLLETCIKYWPAEYHSQSAIDAALQLRRELGAQESAPLDIASIRSIDIHSFDAAVDIIAKDPEKWRPKTRETADHSLPYCTAVALADGDVYLPQFDEARFTDPALLALVAKVRVHRDTELTRRYPAGIPNRITITLTDGRKLVREVEFPRGHARNPMTDAELEAKFHRLAAGVVPPDRQRRLLDTLWHLDELKDLEPLMALMVE